MPKVLVVEDSDDVRENVVRLLQLDKYDVDEAGFGQDAIKLLSSNEYDVLILDWELPDMSGVQICSHYREQGGLAPVMMLTGKSSVADKEIGLNIGADDYLTKPFEARELLARVKALLRRAAMPKPIKAEAAILRELGQGGNLVGKVLCGKYEIVEVIGEGGMGAVYKAKHKNLGHFVAAKIIKKDQMLEERNRKRFEQEAKIMALCKHRNLVMVYDHGHNDDGCPYIVMEYLEGQNLGSIIADRHSLDYEEALPIFMQICDALQHAHQNGLIHRDLKPGNVMLLEDAEGMTVKVLDMGLAKIMPSGDNAGQHLTQTGEIFGSPLYMSPEQGLGNALDHRSDIYSMGCLMYEVLTGTAPFRGDNFIQTVFAHINSPAEPFAKVAPSARIKPSVERAVLSCLAKDPSKRPQSMSDLRDALVEAMVAPDVVPDEVPTSGQQIRPNVAPSNSLVNSGRQSVSNLLKRMSGLFSKPEAKQDSNPPVGSGKR